MCFRCREYRQALAGVVLLVAFIGAGAEAQSRQRPGPAASRGRALEPVETDEGFVIIDGAYVPPPYTIRWKWPAVSVNARPVLVTQRAQLGRRFFAGGRADRVLPRRQVQYVADHLRSGGLILCRAAQAPILVTPGRALTILGILIGEDSVEAKVEKLAGVKGVPIPAAEWAGLAGAFEASAELSERVEYWQARQAELEAGIVAGASPSRAIFTTITFGGFALAVWALGTLLRCRPPLGCEGAERHASGLWDRQVVQLVLVIVALGVHDLVCTLLAYDLGGLWELNPLVAPLLTHGPSVVVFKMGLTVGAAIIFLVARSCRLAQVGSWWVGVVYTILILRWTACSSILLA